jgi:Spy/CpxP family protein refolding chaperone
MTKHRYAWLFAATLFTASAALAGGDGSGRRHHAPPPIDRILEKHAGELGLDEATLDQVRAIAARAHTEDAPFHETLRDAREALHELLRQDAPDLDAILAQADAVGAAETALHKRRLQTLLAVRAVLTPEQRQGLVKIFEEKRKRMFGDGPPPPPPEE